MSPSQLAGRYDLLERLGQQAGRETWRAQDRETGDLVVVKQLRFEATLTWDDWRLFEREVAVLKSLDHPAIPAFLAAFELEAERTLVLVQRYMAAASLTQQLAAGRTFSEAELVALARSLLDILAYLHSRQPPVIHRDIKPSNVLLGTATADNPVPVYLVDFGAVQTLQRDGGTRTIVGTYGYMPPEQFGGRAVPASDLYSLGATLIYLATGTEPADLPQENLRLQFAAACQLSPGLVAWLQRLTEPALERRFASAIAARQSLDAPALVTLPPGTAPDPQRVQVQREADDWTIRIAPAGFQSGLTGAIAQTAFLLVFTTLWTVSAIASRITLFAVLSLPFWLQTLRDLRQVLWELRGEVRLTLTAAQIELKETLLGVTLRAIGPVSRATLEKIELVYQANQAIQLALITPETRFELSASSPTKLSPGELRWLADELSAGLDQPLQIRTLDQDVWV